MRWIKMAYREGVWRERSAFLWFPKTMKNENGDIETRWLEHGSWREQYIGRGSGGTEFWEHQTWLKDEI